MKKKNNHYNRININEQIRATELRVVDDEEGNLGVISKSEALKIAAERGLDLIEISPGARPPVAKIMDYGKYQYELKKKQKEIKAKSHTTETKTIQVKIGTGEHDLELKAKKASEWLAEVHRVKLELYLRGRAKYMDKEFHKERLDRFLKYLTTPHKVADGPKKGPKGLMVVLEKGKTDTESSKSQAPNNK